MFLEYDDLTEGQEVWIWCHYLSLGSDNYNRYHGKKGVVIKNHSGSLDVKMLCWYKDFEIFESYISPHSYFKIVGARRDIIVADVMNS